ncbi:MAG TPA: iron donor protein CyaY [Bryobacteraceae bacterium]
MSQLARSSIGYPSEKPRFPHMDDISFQRHSDEALSSLNRKLATAGDDYGFEADLNDGALKIEFEDPPAKFVVSPNRPVHQIWVSALTKSFKLDWNESRQAFALGATGQTLNELIAEVISTQLGEKVEF